MLGRCADTRENCNTGFTKRKLRTNELDIPHRCCKFTLPKLLPSLSLRGKLLIQPCSCCATEGRSSKRLNIWSPIGYLGSSETYDQGSLLRSRDSTAGTTILQSIFCSSCRVWNGTVFE